MQAFLEDRTKLFLLVVFASLVAAVGYLFRSGGKSETDEDAELRLLGVAFTK